LHKDTIVGLLSRFLRPVMQLSFLPTIFHLLDATAQMSSR